MLGAQTATEALTSMRARERNIKVRMDRARGEIYKKFEANSLSSQPWGLSPEKHITQHYYIWRAGLIFKTSSSHFHFSKNKELLKMGPKIFARISTSGKKVEVAPCAPPPHCCCSGISPRSRKTQGASERRKEAFCERWLRNLGFLFITGHVQAWIIKRRGSVSRYPNYQLYAEGFALSTKWRAASLKIFKRGHFCFLYSVCRNKEAISYREFY